MLKKLLAHFLAIVMLLSLIPLGAVSVTVSAKTLNGQTGECSWSLEGTTLTISGKGAMAGYYEDSPEAPPWGMDVSKVVIKDGVTAIGTCAFMDCEDLTSITIPKSIEKIGVDAFTNTGYYNTASNWKSGVLYIGKYLIKANSMVSTSYTVSSGTVTIADFAFSYCRNLKSIKIPTGVRNIGSGAFFSCTGLSEITFPSGVVRVGNNLLYGTKYYHTDSNWVNGVLYIGKALVCANAKLSGSYKIKSDTQVIADYAFQDCRSLTSVTIPDSVVSMGNGTFSGCSTLEKVVIGNGVKSIGGYTFWPCVKLKSITLGKNVESIGEYAFWWCQNLTSISIPNGVQTIGESAFESCTALKSITLPNSVTTIGESVFGNCQSLATVSLSNKITKLPNYAFDSCYALKKVIIPNAVTEIGKEAFAFCETLKTVTIPKSVTRVDSNAFYDCDALENVYYQGTSDDKSLIRTPGGWNGEIYGAKWHYNSCIDKAKHKYTNACDTSCNVCAIKRTIKHAYKTTVTAKATLTKNGSAVKRCSVCDKLASKATIKHPKTFKLSAVSYTYDGKFKTPTVTVKDAAGKILKKGTDYTVTYASGRKNVGTYKVTVKMIGKYSGTKTLSFKINPVKIAKCKLKLAADVYTYNSAAKTPSVTVKNAAGKTLKKGTDYTVTYASGRKNVGTYKVTVKMKGNYSGSKTLTFKINPPKTTVSKLTAGKKTIDVSITKKSSQVSGYQIQYSTSKSFANATTKTVPSYKTTKLTLKSLKADKTYYVRVRTYKTVNGKKVYSDWSTYKSVKTKK